MVKILRYEKFKYYKQATDLNKNQLKNNVENFERSGSNGNFDSYTEAEYKESTYTNKPHVVNQVLMK